MAGEGVGGGDARAGSGAAAAVVEAQVAGLSRAGGALDEPEVALLRTGDGVALGLLLDDGGSGGT